MTKKIANGAEEVELKVGAGQQGSTTQTAQQVERRYGCGKFTPACFQVFNNPKWLLFVLSWIVFWQSFICNGINNVNVSSLERRFRLESSQVGWVSSAYDFSAGLLAIPFSFLGDRKHKQKLVLFASAIMAVGSVVYMLPHFITGQYTLGQANIDVCIYDRNVTEISCTPDSSSISNYLYMLILGQLLHGVGGSVIYSVSVASLDDNVPEEHFGIYLGIYYAMAALGAAIGYVLGGVLLDIYVDFDVISTPAGLLPSDPRWVGAWWLGACLSTAGFLIGCLLILPFPDFLPGARKRLLERKSETYLGRGDELTGVGESDRAVSFRDLLRASKLMLMNPTFVLITLGGCFEGYATSGFSTYLTKIVQNQFGVQASRAAFYAGAAVVTAVTIGYFLGGGLLKWLKLDVRGMIKTTIVVLFISFLLHPSLFIRCGEVPLAGIFAPYTDGMPESGLSDSCNSGCGCGTKSYDPVCGINDKQYFSPCHAGCLTEIGTGSDRMYHNCSCIVTAVKNTTGSAVPGECKTGCTLLLAVFLLLISLAACAMYTANPIGVAATLRCVPQSEKTYATGLQWVFIRFLGTIPGPVLTGVVVDSSCVVWQRIAGCTGRGSCWVYDNLNLSIYMFGLTASIKVASIFVTVLALCLYRPPKNAETNAGFRQEGEASRTNSQAT